MTPSSKRPSNRNYSKYEVRIPGYIIEGRIAKPEYHPHVLWWAAYIARFLDGKSFDDVMNHPPWPNPKDPLLVNQILKEILDAGWIRLNWENGAVSVNEELSRIFHREGLVGLTHTLRSYETVPGRWWIDALVGTVLSYERALSFDVDTSQSKYVTVSLSPEITPETLVEELNLDLSDLLHSIGIFGYSSSTGPRAYLCSRLKKVGRKDIEFAMIGGTQQHSSRILPGEMASLEPMLLEHAPQVFGSRQKRKKRIFRWTQSPVERFALALEKLPSNLAHHPPGNQTSYLVELMEECLSRKDDWYLWYTTGLGVTPVAGSADLFFMLLREFLTDCLPEFSTPVPASDAGEGDLQVILTTSFLNVNNLEPDEGIIAALEDLPPSTQVLVIYGHASDDSPEMQHQDIVEYLSHLHALLPAIRGQVRLIPAKKRSHEKIILDSKGSWMIGSWNPCSSRPGSKQFETGVWGRSAKFSLEILERVEEIVEGKDNTAFLHKVRAKLVKLTEIPAPDLKAEYNTHLSRLERLTQGLKRILERGDASASLQSLYREALTGLRIQLLPFLQKAQVRLINEHQSRDVLVTQVRKTRSTVFIASDRVTKSALDLALVRDLEKYSMDGKKIVRVLWGREWEEEQEIPSTNRQQLREARVALEAAASILRDALVSGVKPMENHAKFAIFDGARGLVTSENLLSYGGERGLYESRELGVFLESIPVTRFLEGRAILHRPQYFTCEEPINEMCARPYEWLVAGIDIYFAFEELTAENTLEFDFRELKYIQAAIEDDLEWSGENSREELDRFDQQMLEYKRNQFHALPSLWDHDFIHRLWDEGMRYYLLAANSSGWWIPWSIDVPENVKFQEGNLNLFATSLSEDIKKEPIQDPPKLDEASSTGVVKPTIHPVVADLMEHMVLVPAGSFMMGSEKSRDERPCHKVVISRPFYMDKFICTQQVWEAVMGELPYLKPDQKSPNFPVINISYKQVQEFLKRLNELPGSGGFDLPTEAQWEYACRAGSIADYCFGNDPGFGNKPGKLEEYAWTKRNAGMRFHEVGLKKPNAWGLYDMHGLVYEMMRDDRREFSKGQVVDPIGRLNTGWHATRGGAWGRFPLRRGKPWEEHFRCACRSPHDRKEESNYRLSFRISRNCEDGGE